jgi:hypothetical protein
MMMLRSLASVIAAGFALSCSSSSGGGGAPVSDSGSGGGNSGGFGNFGNFDAGDGAASGGSGAGGPSCVGSCGLTTPAPGAFCFCNDLCTTQGNCCPDFATVCANADGGGSGGAGTGGFGTGGTGGLGTGGTGGFGTGGLGTGGLGTGGTGGFGTGGVGAGGTGGGTSACWNTLTCNPGTTCVQNCGACMIQSKKCWTDGTWLPPSLCVPGGCN